MPNSAGKMLIRKLIGIAIRLLGLATLTGCDSRSRVLSLARDVDLDRYAGRWYLIANIPRFAENGNVGSFFDINFHAGRKLTDACATHPKSFDTPTKSCTLAGYVVPGTGNARWRESPFWPLYLSYLILYVDPGYQAALAATRTRLRLGPRPHARHRRRHLPIPARPHAGSGLRHRPIPPRSANPVTDWQCRLPMRSISGLCAAPPDRGRDSIAVRSGRTLF
jgi:lipocalin